MPSPEKSPVRVIDLHEREARVFPRSLLFHSNGTSLVLPETRALSAIDLRDVGAGVELRALGLIGFLPLTADITLNLQPKFPVKNLWQMLSVADEDYERILPILREYETADGVAPHLLLIRGFCHYLRKLLTLGITRSYYGDTHEGHYASKVNFGRTVNKYLSKGDDLNVSADVFSFSSATRINGVLKSACLSFLKFLPRSTGWLDERHLLMEALQSLQRVRSESMHHGEEALASGLPIWLRAPYLGALTVYAVLLGFTKVGFSYESKGKEMPSFLFSLDNIFESFVRNTLAKSGGDNDFSVFDGNLTRHQEKLFLDNKKFPVKPDLIFRRAKKIIGLAEVKYKPKLSETDRYQVISHVVACDAPLGIWISPANTDNEGLEHIGKIRTGANFYHYRIDITGDLASATSKMAGKINALLKTTG